MDPGLRNVTTEVLSTKWNLTRTWIVALGCFVSLVDRYVRVLAFVFRLLHLSQLIAVRFFLLGVFPTSAMLAGRMGPNCMVQEH
jgi:hypothetical protein